jgi:hypothetical protein
MVECFWPGVSAAAVAEATSRLDEASAALTGAGVVARRTVATYVPAEETVMWLFEADGEASLRALARKAEVRFDRVLPVVTSTVVGDGAGGDGVTSGGCRSRRGTTPSTALEPEA